MSIHFTFERKERKEKKKFYDGTITMKVVLTSELSLIVDPPERELGDK